MVFAGIYPADGARYGDLREALEKLQLNDAAPTFDPETSVALGFGFRCGFLGLLHMEIIEERLEREFNLDADYHRPQRRLRNHQNRRLGHHGDNPPTTPARRYPGGAEPIVQANIITPVEYVGGPMELCQDRRGEFIDMKYLDPTRVELHFITCRSMRLSTTSLMAPQEPFARLRVAGL